MLAVAGVVLLLAPAPHATPTPDVPTFPYGELRLQLARHTTAAAKEAASTLEAIARGGTRDAVAGGFLHARQRGDWAVPDFEKRAADNGALLRQYAQAYSATGDLLYRDVARETALWAIRDLRDSTGAFWTSVGSGPDGTYYLWTRAEIEKTLGPERAAEFFEVYRLDPPGVLQLVGSPFAGLGSSRETLLVRRNRRVRPAVDERVLAGVNGLMIGGLATSGALLKRGSDLEAARRAATAVLERLGPVPTLRHEAIGTAARGAADLEDYAYLAEGLLDLYGATGEEHWCHEAQALADTAVSRLWDVQGGGFFGSEGTPGAPRQKSARDGALPSANGVMVSVLFRLSRSTGEARYAALARRTIAAFAADRQDSPTLAASELPEAIDAAPVTVGTAAPDPSRSDPLGR
jgi:uncharacterized protein YyaL (SSP411 family)